MAGRDWDLFFWQRASDLLQQAERIQSNFLQITHYQSFYARSSRWEPPVNVVETEESLWVMAALPGVTAENVKVTLEGRELVIRGERPLPECCKNAKLNIWEIPLGAFERRLTVIEGRNPLQIGKTSLDAGLLIIELRK